MTASPRKLNSDQLGQKGEARFREICNDAKLICNGSTYDRTGWDFIVEFPFSQPDPKATLDKRQAPLSCHVQVKTMWANNSAFSIRLSSAERLAKEPKPTFFYVFKVDDDLQFVEAYLIYLADEALERILKRLREEHAKNLGDTLRLNQKSVQFRLDSSKLLSAPTGEALREAIVALCGLDPEACMRKKSEQLKNLGFEANAYQAETSFILQEDDEIVEILLGLKPVQISKFRVFETRFGVRLPLTDEESDQGLMHIQPGPADHCTVVIKGEGTSTPATFLAEIFVPPMLLPKEQLMFLVKAKLFEIQVRERKLNFSTSPEEAVSTRQTLQEWIQFFRMLVILSRGPGTLSLIPKRLARADVPIKLDEVPDPIEHANMLKAFEGAEALFRLAGAQEPPVLQTEVLALGPRIVGIADLFADPRTAPSLQFRANWRKDVVIPDKLDVLYIDAIEIAGVKLAFSAIAEMTHHFDGAELQWTSRALVPREITPIRDFEQDYEGFCNRSKVETGLDTVMMAMYDEPKQDVIRP